MPKHVLIVAGDASADQHAAALVRALKEKDPGLRVTALGGMHLKAVGDAFLYPLVGVGGFGFLEPLFKIPQLWGVLRRIQTLFKKDRPDVVIPVDYYGFNIHVARAAKKIGIPVVYYISPQVWASRPRRIQELAKVLTKMLVIFPFEKDLYEKAGVPVAFVGHPLVDRVPMGSEPNGTLTIGLLPGSRRSIVERHLPIVISAAEVLRDTFHEADFVLFRPSEIEEAFYRPHLRGRPWMRLIQDTGYEERRKLMLALSVSGTAALENMLLGVPMIILYKLSPITFAVARKLIRVPFVAMPNILAGKAVVPELLQDEAEPQKIARMAENLLKNRPAWQEARRTLLSLRERLGHGGSSRLAADEILKAAS